MTQRPTSGDEQFSVSGAMSDTGSSTTGSTQPITTGTTTASTYEYGTQQQSGTQGALDQAKQTAGDVADQAKQQAGQLADQAKQQVSSRLGDQKERAAQSLDGVAQALRQTGQQMHSQDQQSGITQYVDQAADQVERLSGYLQNHDVGEIVDGVERYARRQPALFLGGAFALGLLGARFLKSSSSSGRSGNYPIVPRDQYSNRSYSSGYSDTSYGRGSYGSSGSYGSTLGTTSGTSVGSTSGAYGSTTSGSYGSSIGTTQTGLVGADTSDYDATLGRDVGTTGLGGTSSSGGSTMGSADRGSTSGTRERGGTEGL